MAIAAGALALPLIAEGGKLAGDVVGHISAALNKSIVELHVVGQSKPKKGHKPIDIRTDLAIPAWLIVGGAVALWILGLGIRPTSSGLALVERPRMLLPFTTSSGGPTSSLGPVGGIAGQIACTILPPPLNLICSAVTAL